MKFCSNAYIITLKMALIVSLCNHPTCIPPEISYNRYFNVKLIMFEFIILFIVILERLMLCMLLLRKLLNTLIKKFKVYDYFIVHFIPHSLHLNQFFDGSIIF